jgi:CRP-like cAMP-binding protein
MRRLLRRPQAFLSKNYLLSGLSDVDRMAILERMEILNLKKWENLFREGEPADHFYVVKQGLVKLFRASEDGKETIFELFKPGEGFGEAIMFMEQCAYPVCAQAVLTSEVYAFPTAPFMEILRASSDARMRMMRVMSRRLLCQLTDIYGICSKSGAARLIQYLLDQLSDRTDAEPVVHLNVPKYVIASRLSIQPETFSRILNQLQRKQLISVNRKEIRIHDIERLQDEADESRLFQNCGRTASCYP